MPLWQRQEVEEMSWAAGVDFLRSLPNLQKEAMGQLWIVLAKHHNLRQESHA